MDHSDLIRSYSDIDLESGGGLFYEDGENSNKLLKRVWSGFLGLRSPDKTERVKTNLPLYDKLLDLDEITIKKKKFAKKKVNGVKPAKPPRPPKGPSLNAADVKLVKEITERTMLKRERLERVKALKKMKREKGCLMNSNLFAMVITLLFFLVIIMQGLLGSRV